jgi:hypothetical protein
MSKVPNPGVGINVKILTLGIVKGAFIMGVLGFEKNIIWWPTQSNITCFQ